MLVQQNRYIVIQKFFITWVCVIVIPSFFFFFILQNVLYDLSSPLVLSVMCILNIFFITQIVDHKAVGRGGVVVWGLKPLEKIAHIRFFLPKKY